MSNFQNQNFLEKYTYLVQFRPRIPKNVIYFYVRQLKMSKIAFRKTCRHHLYPFFDHCKAINEDTALKFGICVVCMYVHTFITCSSFFLDDSQSLDYIGIYFLIIKILSFGGQNRHKYKKIWDRCFVERSLIRLLTFSNCVLLQNYHSRSLQTFAAFWPKIAEHDVTKTPFSQNCLAWSFLKFWYNTSNWCVIRYWKFRVEICRRFWAIEKIREG